MIAQRITEIEQNISAENTQQQVQQSSDEDNNAVQTSAIKITVNLAPQFTDKLPTQGTLFVFAKAANGPPMPLAVVKLTDYSFPIEVQLSDSNAMVAGLTLSSVDKIILTARISKDASVMPSTGELEGRSDVLERSQTKAYDLLINELIP
jgi:hypothetical protein